MYSINSDELIIIFFYTDISITMTTAIHAPIDSKGQEKKTKSWGDLQIPMVVVVNF